MTVKRGKHKKVEGGFKSFLTGVGVIGLILSVAGFANGDAGFGLIIAGISIGIIVLASKIPDKDQITF
ncbi:MAG: hypothetical protein JKY46_08595 [Robiginitomaculum sp.]|nr:hypothetical protein [Robiginitomaculum sp.]